MLVVLIEDVEEKNKRGEVILNIPNGFRFNSIEPEYLSSETRDELGDVTIERLRNRDSFLFMFRGIWVAVPKEICYIPVTSTGWRYNI